jgi:putative endonuclease
MPYFCYLLECADGSFYAGWTTDPARRERQHNRGTGARYTRFHRPVRLVYVESLPDRSALKRLSHAQKRVLAEKNSMDATPAATPPETSPQ